MEDPSMQLPYVENLCMMARAFVSGQINMKDTNGNTALHYAATKSDIEWVKFFLKKGADTRVKNNDGNTPLHLAAEKNEVDDFYHVAKELFDNDTVTDITQPRSLANCRNNKQETPLHLLLKKPNVSQAMVNLFLDNRADIFAKSSDGSTPVLMVDQFANREVADLINYQLERRFFE